MNSSPIAAVVRSGRWRRRLLAVALGLLVLLLAGLISVTCAVTYRPGWYQPAAVNYARLPQDKQAFVALLDSVSAALNRGQAIEVTIEQDQLNRWLAARDEVFPPEWQRFGPLRDPFVEIMPQGRLRLAARVRQRGLTAIASLELRVTASPETIRLEVQRLGIGLLPVGAGWLAEQVAARLLRRAQVRLDPDATALEAPNRLTWPNGRRRFRITGLHSEAGRLHVRLEPR